MQGPLVKLLYTEVLSSEPIFSVFSQNEELRRAGNHSEGPSVGGSERRLGTSTANIDERSALELGRDLLRLLGGAGTLASLSCR